MKAGLNLYSIRTLIKTEEEFTSTALKLKDMGYEYLQFSGCAYDPEKIKRVVDASGLPVVLTHIALDKILDDPEKLAEEHLYFGCSNIGLGTIPGTHTNTEEDWTKTIDKLNIAAEKMKKVGCKFFFHHHHYEFFRLKSGKTVFEYMIENAPNFNFTVDSYWVKYGGYDPLAFVDK
ncbi:MAG: hypothetical protein IJW47_04015, partial [Clostridia bacterium]|nr:hypothetical protein [Clostridia bacterium]